MCIAEGYSVYVNEQVLKQGHKLAQLLMVYCYLNFSRILCKYFSKCILSVACLRIKENKRYDICDTICLTISSYLWLEVDIFLASFGLDSAWFVICWWRHQCWDSLGLHFGLQRLDLEGSHSCTVSGIFFVLCYHRPDIFLLKNI